MHQINVCTVLAIVGVLVMGAMSHPLNNTSTTTNAQGSTTTSSTTSTTTASTKTTPSHPPETTTEDSFFPGRICQQNFFTCGDESCVPILKVCDGSPDCTDGSDEASCDHLSTATLGQQMEAIMSQYPGCPASSQVCSAHIASLGMAGGASPPTDPLPSREAICRAYTRASRCLVWESCQYSREHRNAMIRLSTEIVRRESGCTLRNLDRPPRCVSSCTPTMSGNFQSCNGCGMFATCDAGVLYDYRPCPAGLVWDDRLKRCEHYSTTCPEQV